MKRAQIQIKRARCRMIGVHHGNERVQNQIFLRYNRIVKPANIKM